MPDPPPSKRIRPIPCPPAPLAQQGGYAELHCRTNFSFLEGASHPDELALRAAELGYAALAVTDRNSLAGVVRAHAAAKELGLKLLIGSELTPQDASPVVVLATDRAAYARLCRLLTLGRRNAPKGECRFTFTDLANHAAGLLGLVLLPSLQTHADPEHELIRYRDLFEDRCYAVAELHLGADDDRQLRRMHCALNILCINAKIALPISQAGTMNNYPVIGKPPSLKGIKIQLRYRGNLQALIKRPDCQNGILL